MNRIKKIKEFFKKIFLRVGENPLPAFLVLILLALVFGILIFYQYSFLAEKREPQAIERPLQFKEALFQKILEEWGRRQKRFDEADLKEYRDLFKVSVPEQLTP